MYHSGELHYKLGRPPPPPEDPRPASPPPPRSRPPPDDAPPPLSRSIPAPPHRGNEERSQMPAGTSAGVKRDRKAFASTPPREVPSQSRRGGQGTTAGSSTAYGTLRQGTRDAPIVIVDGPSEVSSEFEDRMRSAVNAANHLTSRASRGTAAISRGDGDTSEEEELSAVDEAELAESQGFSFGSQSGARQGSSFKDQSGAKRRRVATDESASRSQRRQTEGDDEQDSRYAEHSTKGLRKARADRREYVERNSESDSDASMHSLDEHPTSQSRATLTASIPQRGISIAGTAKGTATAASVTTTSIKGGHRIAQMRDKAAQKKQVADYWAAKAQGSNIVSEESEEGEVHE
ncbi:hypothetical protein IE81DRAFT_10109 [Ceraceosorus guamensis]|uniref:Uncharacterized protein n=1 Tax=Ceraceosorus guamensis TaxID=1522189 RepID=A0A316W4Q9_9BASI|nr:hypothetical protein IE81DRAFT_10109 [Ceraceosorus guamensis]PWN44544.1 hypothetical protein IE81DRAFT_10109 [Ceraceosorus guamensis]